MTKTTTRPDYVQVTISCDPATLGPEATPNDLAGYARQLASELTGEFGLEVQVRLGSVARAQVAATHPSLNEQVDAVEDRVREIEADDEWVEILRRSTDVGVCEQITLAE